MPSQQVEDLSHIYVLCVALISPLKRVGFPALHDKPDRRGFLIRSIAGASAVVAALALRGELKSVDAISLETNAVKFANTSLREVDSSTVGIYDAAGSAYQTFLASTIKATTAINPTADNAVPIGTSALRYTTLAAATAFRIFAASGAANPTYEVGSSGFRAGAGGASAVDVTLDRRAANILRLATGDAFETEAIKILTTSTLTVGSLGSLIGPSKTSSQAKPTDAEIGNLGGGLAVLEHAKLGSRLYFRDDSGVIRDAAGGDMVSPMKDAFVPFSGRMMYDAFYFFEDPYFVCEINALASQAASLLTLHKVFDGGTYEWLGKIRRAPDTSTGSTYLGFEWHHGTLLDGIIAFIARGTQGTYECVVATGGAATYSGNIAGQNWTVERTFRVEWTTGQVVFKVDGAIVATITTNVPAITTAMVFFIEAISGTGTPSSKQGVYLKKDSLTEI